MSPVHQHYPGPPSRRHGWGVDSSIAVARALLQLRKQTRGPLGPFWLFWKAKKQAGPKNIFVKKMGIWQIWGAFWGGLAAHIARAQCAHRGRTLYFLGPFRDPFEVQNNPGGVGLDGPRNLAGPRPVKDTPETYDPQKMAKKNFFRTCNISPKKFTPKGP